MEIISLQKVYTYSIIVLHVKYSLLSGGASWYLTIPVAVAVFDPHLVFHVKFDHN